MSTSKEFDLYQQAHAKAEAAADAYNTVFDANSNDPRLPVLAIRKAEAIAARADAKEVYLAPRPALIGTSVGVKRRFSEYFGEMVVSEKSMRLDAIPGLLFQGNKRDDDDEIEDVKEKAIEFEFLTMNDFPPLMHPEPSSKIIMVRPCYKVIYGQLLEYLRSDSPRYMGENYLSLYSRWNRWKTTCY
jgi:hypothetical protein